MAYDGSEKDGSETHSKEEDDGTEAFIGGSVAVSSDNYNEDGETDESFVDFDRVVMECGDTCAIGLPHLAGATFCFLQLLLLLLVSLLWFVLLP